MSCYKRASLPVSIHAPARGATNIQTLDERNRAVSIHAPARGATPLSTSGIAKSSVSIHAPARGATEICAFSEGLRCFNSRSREGSDLAESILKSQEFRFQFTLPRGERRNRAELDLKRTQFQFTLPRGERQSCAQGNPHQRRFQWTIQTWEPPRQIVCILSYYKVSIHAPARGATAYDCPKVSGGVVSIHAPARGATSQSLGLQ